MNPNPPPPPPPSFDAPSETTTWWQRNKKWAIPVGCLGLAVVVGCCGLAGVMGMGFTKLAAFGKEQVATIQVIHTQATARVEASQAVRDHLGEPISVGAVQSPNYRAVNGEVSYSFEIPVSGPKGELLVEGRAHADGSGQPLRLRSLAFDNGTNNVELLDDEVDPAAE